MDFRAEQYEQVLSLKDSIAALANWQTFFPYRPKTTPLQDPKAWWRYAMVQVTVKRGNERSATGDNSSRTLSSRPVGFDLFPVSLPRVDFSVPLVDRLCKFFFHVAWQNEKSAPKCWWPYFL